MRIYRLIVHHETPVKVFEWIRKKQVICIGWGKIGDICGNGYRDFKEIGNAIKSAYPELHNWSTGGPSLHRFAETANCGDLVILSVKGHRAAVVQIVSDYYFSTRRQPFAGEYYHQRAVRFVGNDPDELWAQCGKWIARGNSIRQTFVECGTPAGRCEVE